MGAVTAAVTKFTFGAYHIVNAAFSPKSVQTFEAIPKRVFGLT